MSSALTGMAQTCQTMMQMEMANIPLKVTAISIFGLLAAVALGLLVVLEIQWIRLTGARIKTARRAAK